MAKDEFHLKGPEVLKFWDTARELLQAVLARHMTLETAVSGMKRLVKEAKDARETTPPPRN